MSRQFDIAFHGWIKAGENPEVIGFSDDKAFSGQCVVTQGSTKRCAMTGPVWNVGKRHAADKRRGGAKPAAYHDFTQGSYFW